MQRSGAEERFFQSTRGRVILLLREESRTIEDLAARLGITDNAVRTHIAALERDGLVRRGASRHTGGKPAYTYHLTADADRLFPKAYGIVLREFLRSLDGRVSRDAVTDALRDAGRRLATSLPRKSGPLEERVRHASNVLTSMGGLATARNGDDGYVIDGLACPLADAVEGDGDACLLAESMLADLIGAPVREACDKGEHPRCRFMVSASSGKERRPPTT